MSYLRHLRLCNDFDPNRYLPFFAGDLRVGFVRREAAKALADYPGTFRVGDQIVTLAPGLDGATRITAAIAEAADGLIRRGVIEATRGELFAVTERWNGRVLFELDRGVVPFFGTRSYGVHLNGLRLHGDVPELWIGTRAADKKIAPGKLDNLVAGGMASGHDSRHTLFKEAAEEAAMPAGLAETAFPVGAITYRMALREGMRDDVLFVYDIELPPDFAPRNTDGEIASFQVMPVAECLRLVAETDEFKFNVNLVLIDLALRRGWIGPEQPDYLALLSGLRGALVREPR